MIILQRTSVLWLLFFATVAISAGFTLWAPFIGGTALDRLSSVNEVHFLLARMTEDQKIAHIEMTLMMDMLYPLVYGALFAGLTLKFSGKIGIWLAVPALVVIPVDLMENIVELLALTGWEDFLWLKAALTPAKFLLFFVAAAIAFGALIFGLVQIISKHRAAGTSYHLL